MGEIISGFYTFFSNPIIYNNFQNLIGARKARERLVKEFIKPFPGVKIIDIGCGPGTILEYLPKDIKYTGFDINYKYIEYAKQRYGDRGEFVCKRVGEFINNYPNYFDIAIAAGLLHHLEDKEAKKLFSIAEEILIKRGRIITIDAVFIKKQNIIAKFIISMDQGAKYQDA